MESKRDTIVPDTVHICSHRNNYSLYLEIHYLLGGINRRELLVMENPAPIVCIDLRIPGDHPDRILFLRPVPVFLELLEENR